MAIKIYLNGGAEMDKCLDCEQSEINEGDVLTSDFYADFEYHSRFNPDLSKEDIKTKYSEPFFLVKKHINGYLYAESLYFSEINPRIKQRMYLHNFRFSTTKRLGVISDFKHLLEE